MGEEVFVVLDETKQPEDSLPVRAGQTLRIEGVVVDVPTAGELPSPDQARVNALPGTDPISSFRRRRPMVPLTDAWIEYSTRETGQRRRVSTVVINRHQADWVVEAADEEIELPDLPPELGKGPLVKDFTGHVYVELP